MLLEPDAVTGNCIEGRKRIIGSAKQPVSLLVSDDEDDVVGRFAGGPRAPHLAFGGLRASISQVQHQA